MLMLARLAIALVLLLPSVVSARAEYFCRPLQRVVSSSCCAGARAPQQRPADATPRIRAEDCCQRLPAAARTSVPGTRPESERVTAPLAASLEGLPVRVALPALAACQRWFERSITARVHGPPLFIANCALLN
jgi:hypothetical protein